MAEATRQTRLKNRVDHQFDTAIIQAQASSSVVGLGAVGSPEYTLGLLGALTRAFTVAKLSGTAPQTNLLLWMRLCSFTDTDAGGLVTQTAILDGITELRALGEESLRIQAETLDLLRQSFNRLNGGL